MMPFIRTTKDKFFHLFVFGAGTCTIFILLATLSLVFIKGAQSITLQFLITPMRSGGSEGGILYQFIGTIILLMTTLAIVTPLSVGTALSKSVYLKSKIGKKMITLLLHILNGVPSILFGLFGFFFFVKFLGWGKSWLTGGILLAMMIYPLVTISLSEGIDRIPKEYIENAKSLGLSQSAIIYSVILPQSISLFFSGLLLGLARAAGETAPIMFAATIFAGATVPSAIKESPVLSLPYHILNLAQESFQPQALQNAWGSAAVLVSIVIILSLCALPLRMKTHEEAKF